MVTMENDQKVTEKSLATPKHEQPSDIPVSSKRTNPLDNDTGRVMHEESYRKPSIKQPSVKSSHHSVRQSTQQS